MANLLVYRRDWVLVPAVFLGLIAGVALVRPTAFAFSQSPDLQSDSKTSRGAKIAKVGQDESSDPTPRLRLLPVHTRPIRVDVDLVVLNVLVTDTHDRSVTGLGPSNFEIYDDKVPQRIAAFSEEDVPLSVGVLFDSSGSMADKIERSRAAVWQFLKTSNPQDEFLLINFSSEPHLVSGFTANLDDLQTLLVGVQGAGRTALLDAIYIALLQMRKASASRKALLVISDGGDNHSCYTERDVRRLIQESGAQIYAVGVFSPAGAQRRAQEEIRGPQLLDAIAEESGGRMFSTTDASELPAIMRKLSMELRNQYAIAYRPSNLIRDGRWRRVKVKVDPPSAWARLHVYGRVGYYAPTQ
jgi:Ca-activated chloride channel homolog